ncbi:hypothetical protein HAX54_029195, partial [Datura stramonium]|nr:hypothetical protein [Datura stramonium]
ERQSGQAAAVCGSAAFGEERERGVVSGDEGVHRSREEMRSAWGRGKGGISAGGGCNGGRFPASSGRKRWCFGGIRREMRKEEDNGGYGIFRSKSSTEGGERRLSARWLAEMREEEGRR